MHLSTSFSSPSSVAQNRPQVKTMDLTGDRALACVDRVKAAAKFVGMVNFDIEDLWDFTGDLEKEPENMRSWAELERTTL